MKQIKFKRGDTFNLYCTYKVDGVATSVTSIDIDSQIRNKRGNLVATLSDAKQVQTGVFVLKPVVSDTSSWPVDVLQCDIQLSENGVIRSTDTFSIVVLEEITK